VSDEGNDLSPEQQRDENAEAATQHGWRLVVRYSDRLSASRYARKERSEWPKFVERVRAGALDVAILWENSRGGRELENWAGFLNAARRVGCKIYITSRDRLYDMENSEDYRTLAQDGIDSVYESEKISRRSRRGIASKLDEPYGRLPYGYARTYERVRGRPKPVVHQAPHPDRAPVAREIITRISEGEAVSAIQRDLDRREVLNPSGRPGWARSTIVRLVLEGYVYIGKRRHNGSGLIDGNWPPIVDEDVYWKAVAVLRDPARKVAADTRGGIRPGAAKHLCSYVAKCGKCGDPLATQYRPRGGQMVLMYRCASSGGGCAYAPAEWMDGVVADEIIRWCAEPGRYERYTREDDRAALAARDEAASERARLEGFEQQAIAGKITPAAFARIAAGIEKNIATLDARAAELSAPPALRGLLATRHPTAYRRLAVLEAWEAMPLAARRSVISEVAAPTLAPTGRGGDVFNPERISMNFKDQERVSVV